MFFSVIPWKTPFLFRAGFENGRPKPVLRAGRAKFAAMFPSVAGRVQTAIWTTSLVWWWGAPLDGENYPGLL